VDVEGHRMNAHNSFRTCLTRFREQHQTIAPHVVADSAWGSFDLLDWARTHNIRGTLSMPKKTWAWLPESLTYGAPLDSGRIAFLPEFKYLYSAYNVINDKSEVRTVKTLTSAFSFQVSPESETEVAYVTERQRDDQGRYEYLTVWASGKSEWLPSSSFMDDDGTFTNAWLHFADESDVKEAISSLTVAELNLICTAQSWKVSFLLSKSDIVQTSGNKADIQDRIVRHTMELKSKELEWAVDSFESLVGPFAFVTLSRSFLFQLGKEKNLLLESFDAFILSIIKRLINLIDFRLKFACRTSSVVGKVATYGGSSKLQWYKPMLQSANMTKQWFQ
jgi:hypothetical protein